MKIDIKHPSLSTADRIGFNCAGMMANIDWDNTAEVNRFVDMVNTIQPDMMRVFDGGGYRYLHIMFDKNGNPSKGLGYDIDELTSAHTSGALSDEDFRSYTEKANNAPEYRYIDKFIEVYQRFQKKPKVIYMVNVLYETPENEAAAVDLLIDGGVNVVGVELGNESYNSSQFNAKFQDYLTAVTPFANEILDRHPGIKVSLVAAPVFERRFEKWNLDLSAFLQSPTFDVTTVVPHIYCKVDQIITDQYTNGYGSTKQNYQINFDSPDTSLQPLFEDGLSAFRTFAEVTLPEIVAEYKRLFPGSQFWVTEWGTTPPFPLGNTFLDVAYILSAMPVWYKNPEFELLGYQTFHGPAFHASSTPVKDSDPITFQNPVFRSKYFAWYLLSYLHGYSYLETQVVDGRNVIVMKRDNKIALLTLNDQPISFDVIAETDEPNTAFGFQNSTTCSFGQLYGSNGENEIYHNNKFYGKGHPVERNVEVATFEDAAGVPPYSISLAFFSIVTTIPEEPPVHSGRPHIHLPKHLKGRFSFLIQKTQQS